MPSIFEQLEEVKTQMVEADKAEIKEEPVIEKTEEPKEVEVKEPEEVVEENEDEEEAPIVAKTKEEHIKERRQSRADLKAETERANARAAAAEAALLLSKQPPKEEIKAPERPDPMQDPDGARDYDLSEARKIADETKKELAEIRKENLQNKAKAELANIESDFAKSNPDFHEVVNDGYERMKKAVRATHPKATESDINSHLEEAKFSTALEAVRNGLNPAEVTYNRMKAMFDYQPKKVTEEPVGKTETERYDAVKKNKAKSGSPLSSGGSTGSGNHITTQALLNMTPKEYAKLSDSEKARFRASAN